MAENVHPSRIRAGNMVLTGTTSDGSTYILTLKDSSGITVFDVDSDGRITGATATFSGVTLTSISSGTSETSIVTIASNGQVKYRPSFPLDFYTPSVNQTFNSLINLERNYTQYNNYTITGATILSGYTGTTIGGSAEGILIADGNNTPTLYNIVKWVNSADYSNILNKQNNYYVFMSNGVVYIIWTQLN